MGARRSADRLDRGLGHRLVVTVGLAAFVVTTYVVVVLGGGRVIGRTDVPSLPLSVLATAVLALLLPHVQSALERLARAIGCPAPATPYDVLRRFSGAVTGGDAAAGLPARMSTVLARGTGAEWAQVWLVVSDHLTLAATWPADADDDGRPPSPLPDATDTGTGRRALAVKDADHLLGVLRLQERAGSPLTPVEERLFGGLAAQAGLVLRLVGLRTELEGRRGELAARADDLRASRERIVATQDVERRHLERDIHDGAQQHLVALAVNLRLAQTIAGRSPDRAARLLGEQAQAADVAIETLTSLSRGIYPRLLADEGLAPAVRSAASSGAVPVTVDTTVQGRLPAAVEAALYFSCLEAVQNAAKHSGARSIHVHLDEHPAGSRLTIVDDGAGFDPEHAGAAAGAGLANMRDRLDAVGGRLTVESASGVGTTITAEVPGTRTGEPGPASRSAPGPVG